MIEKEEIDILYHVNMWQWLRNWHIYMYVCIYMYSSLCFIYLFYMFSL